MVGMYALVMTVLQRRIIELAITGLDTKSKCAICTKNGVYLFCCAVAKGVDPPLNVPLNPFI